jgi:hypothetical protein
VTPFYAAALTCFGEDEEREAGDADIPTYLKDEERKFSVCVQCAAVCSVHRSKLEARLAQAFADAAEVERAGEGKEAAEARRLRWKRVRSAAGALKKRSNSLPAKQVYEYRGILRSRFGTDDIDDPRVQWLWYPSCFAAPIPHRTY